MLPLTTPNPKPQDEIVPFWGHRMEYGSVESRLDGQMEISSPTLNPVLLIAVYEDTGPHLLFIIYKYMGNLGEHHYYFIL